MKNAMTYAVALNTAIEALKEVDQYNEVVERLMTLNETLARRSGNKSDASRAKQAEKRKAETAQKRAEMVADVIPILRDTIKTDMTAKEIFEAAKERLPEGFTAPKVQNILLREMAPTLIKTERKGKANTYRLV